MLVKDEQIKVHIKQKKKKRKKKTVKAIKKLLLLTFLENNCPQPVEKLLKKTY